MTMSEGEKMVWAVAYYNTYSKALRELIPHTASDEIEDMMREQVARAAVLATADVQMLREEVALNEELQHLRKAIFR